jgi:MFS family permease
MSEQKKFWGARLKEGVSPGNLLVYYIVTLFMMTVVVSCNVLQPYLLSTFIKVPLLEIGTATANISLVNEFVLLIFFGLWGVISDKSGRRLVWAIGCIIIGVGYVIMPLAGSVVALIGFRMAYTIGIAAGTGMMATVLADYVVNEDRGKASAVMGIMNGFGAVIGAVMLGNLPQMYAKAEGVNSIEAGWRAYLTCAAIAVAVAILAWFGLSKKKPAGSERISFGEKLKVGFAAAKEDAGVALAYSAAFVSRADLVVPGLYLPLWLSKFYQGKIEATATMAANSPEYLALLEEASRQGIAKGGAILGLIGGAGLLFAPVIGILCDKINRVSALAFGLSFNFVGYGLIFFVADPTGPLIYIAAVIIGCGSVGGTIAAQVMIQQQAKPALRGSIIGFFGMCGALGIMIMCWAGGYIFDAISEQSPFVVLGALNLGVFILALALKSRIKAPEDA